MKVGDYVRIGNGRKVYQIIADKVTDLLAERYLLAASADHPDAAERVPDALRWYAGHELTRVRRRCDRV